MTTKNEKKTVNLWDSSWQELLYVLKLNEHVLDTSQFEVGFDERPPDSGRFHIKPVLAKSNLKNIVDEITKQLGREGCAEVSVAKHKEILNFDPLKSISESEKQNFQSS